MRISVSVVCEIWRKEKEGEVRIPESKELRNALREIEKVGENKRIDAEDDII